MARTSFALLLLLGLVCGALAELPQWYNCDCSKRDNCACPSTSAPGGLAPEDTPQFILFSHDDAIVDLTERTFRGVCDGRKNPDGCPFRATMFTQAADTDCTLAKGMYADGYEIATHTVNHVGMYTGFPRNSTVAEILGAKRFLADQCGIPEADIRGFRSPYLKTNPVVRQVLYENGFRFDSTLMEGAATESVSKSMAKRAWPYTMDFGIPQNCAWFSDTQECQKSERWPGLWEVPMWILSVLNLEFTMDVGFYGGRGVYEPLMATFDEAYKGNRAPVPIFVHTTWVEKDPSRVDELKRFADYTMTKPDVFWVTMSQLIEWMKNPVPASQLASSGALCKAKPPTPRPVALPRTGANVTITLKGTPTQVADQGRRLEAAVGRFLGSAVAGSPAVAQALAAAAPSVASTPATSAAPSGASSAHAAGASAGSMSVQADSLATSWLQFEGPAYTSYSVASDGGGGIVKAASMDGWTAPLVKVTVAAAGADPLALYKHASQAASRSALAKELTDMGLEPAGEPAVLPIKDGIEMALPSPPSAPAVQPPQSGGSLPVASPATPPAEAATTGASDPAQSSAGAPASAAQESTDTTGDSSLSAGAIAGIAVGAAAVVAAVVGLLVWRQRRHSAAASAPGDAPPSGPTDADTSKGTAPQGSVAINVSTA